MAQARTAKPKQSDFTGRERDKAMAEAAKEVKERKAQMSMATSQAQQEFDEGVHDPRVPDSPTIVDEVEDLGGVAVAEQPDVVIRVNEDIEEMTYGYGNTYNMKAGGRYKVPKKVADHLETLGLVWH